MADDLSKQYPFTNDEKLDAFVEYPLASEPDAKRYPNGWMSYYDLTVLYNAARKTKGDLLEIGPWLGRSSTALASGLRDRQLLDGKKPVIYDIIDFGITSPDEWFDRFGVPFRWDHDKGRVLEAILHPGGSNAVLVSNLKRLGVLPYTNTIMRGDFLTSPINRTYDTIFCDALHDKAEIKRTMPRLKELLAPGAMLVADDVVTEKMVEQIGGYIDIKDFFFSRTERKKGRRKVCVMHLE